MLLLVVCALLFASATQAQTCCGDCNADGRIAVSELISAVGNNLTGCAAATCCGDCDASGEVRVNELIQSVDNALNDCIAVRFCPMDLSIADPNACTFRGRFNGACGGRLNVHVTADGHRVLIALDIAGRTLAHRERGTFGPLDTVFIEARMASHTDASLVGWFTRQDGGDLTQLLGALSMIDGRHLVIETYPADVPFTLDDCKFKRFEGELLRVD